MKLKQYLESREGMNILSTANADGMVTSAIYSRPHVFDDGTIAFVRRRLTYENLKTNPYASYMFIEESQGYQGIRLFLKKIKEDTCHGSKYLSFTLASLFINKLQRQNSGKISSALSSTPFPPKAAISSAENVSVGRVNYLRRARIEQIYALMSWRAWMASVFDSH